MRTFFILMAKGSWQVKAYKKRDIAAEYDDFINIKYTETVVHIYNYICIFVLIRIYSSCLNTHILP